MGFPTGLLLLRASNNCCDSAALYRSHWRCDHSKPTEMLLEHSGKKKSREKAAVPNLSFSVFACTLFFKLSTKRKVFLWTAFAFWTSPSFTPKLRLLELHRLQATVIQVWRLPVDSYIHRIWVLLAELTPFLLREKNILWKKYSLLFLYKNKLYTTSLQNYADFLSCISDWWSKEAGNCQKISPSRQTMPL